MPKLEYSPINDFQKFNFIGKRLFDFLNTKINITTGKYFGNGISGRQINVDIIPRLIAIFNRNDLTPIVWIDSFPINFSKGFDGTTKIEAIMSLTGKKDAFILGDDTMVNDVNVEYFYIVFGE